MKIDPTRTKLMRYQYEHQLIRLFKRFKKMVTPLLVKQVLDEYGRFQPRSFSDDIDDYIERQTRYFILDPSKTIVKNNIRRAYNSGKKKAETELLPYQLGRDMTPLDWESLIMLQDISFNRIKDCSLNMQNAITYSCSKGVMEGWGAEKIAREIYRNVDGNNNMGITRARTIARTEIINAYNQSKMNQYKQTGLSQYEWLTAIDERTCDECVTLDGKIFNVGEGQIPPAHPNCRCSTVPVVELGVKE